MLSPERKRLAVIVDVPYEKERPVTEHVECATLPLREAIPRSYSQFYDPKIYADEKNINDLGRPKFTDRNLIDWGLNDIRSLLFRPRDSANWPEIREAGFHITSLPLDAPDCALVEVLASSDLFKEHRWLTANVRREVARCIVRATRVDAGSGCLTLPQWRHMIEEYMLNLACQVQCRSDYRKALAQLKNNKSSVYGSDSDIGSPPELQPDHVTVEERCRLWRSCQKALYNRLNLDWELDPI